MSDSILTLSDATFDESVLGSDVPVVIDFWAEWCGPCKMIAPVLEDIANENKGKLAVAKLNVDDNPDVARRYEVLPRRRRPRRTPRPARPVRDRNRARGP